MIEITTQEIVIFTVLLVGFFVGAFYMMRRDQKYLHKKTKEALSKNMKEEIEKERNENIRKKQLFEEMMKKVKK